MKLAKGFRGRYFSLAAIAATVGCINLQAVENSVQSHEQRIAQTTEREIDDDVEELEDIVVETVDYPLEERLAPYSTEIYTSQDIRNSQSTDLYQFLNDHTSVVVSSSYGNRFSPKLDIRGYGLENGYENIVVTVNGRRMNNIDMTGPLLASIPIDSIERIEIIKGAGVVEYGDGANAGVINIVTKKRNGAELKGYWGNYRERYGMASASYASDHFDIDAFIDRYSNGGIISSNMSDQKDSQYSRNGHIDLTVKPIDWMALSIGYADNGDHLFYAGPISKKEYDEDITKARALTEQRYRSKVYNYGMQLVPTENFDFEIKWFQEGKSSEYITYHSGADYWYNTWHVKAHYDAPWAHFTFGYDRFDGSRKSYGYGTNDISKENEAWYAKVDKRWGSHTISAGYRSEKVSYDYRDTGRHLASDDRENGWNLGYNYAFSDFWSGYASYTKAYQTPDIDRFFDYTGQFNQFIDPMTTRTAEVGINYVTKRERIKVSLFHIDVDDEIFYDPITYRNTNLDKTKKEGIEIYGKHLFENGFWGSLNYTYVDAKIKEVDGHPDYEDKRMPGVSKHNAVLSAGYRSDLGWAASLSQVYRSSAYAFEDFTNSFRQKQAPYVSTNAAISYRYHGLELFANVNNLFDRKNGLWVHDDAIYAVDYKRTYRFGMKLIY